MPIKEYQCINCGSTCELIIGIGRNSDKVVCKSCGSTALQDRISAPAPPVIGNEQPHGTGPTCCGGTPSDKGCIPGSCCGSS